MAIDILIPTLVSQTITDGVTILAPSENAVFDALAGKQNSLGFTPEDVANKQTDLTSSATKYPTVDAVNTGLSGKQAALISGTNIKTINGNNLLGAGNLVISAAPAGSTGEVQFNNAGAFGADSGLSWDNTNKRLGIGATPASNVRVDIRSQGALSTDIGLRVRNSGDNLDILKVRGDNVIEFLKGKGNAMHLGAVPNEASAYYLSITHGAASALPFMHFSNNLYSVNVDRFCNIDLNGGAGNTNGSGSLILGAGNVPSTRNFQLTVASLTGISKGTNDSGFAQSGADTSGNNAIYSNYIGKNWTLGNTSQGNGKIVFAIVKGTAPTNSITGAFQLFSANSPLGAGTACANFLTEDLKTIKIYQETTGVSAATFVANTGINVHEASTFDGYTMAQVVKALRNQGLLA